MSETQQDLVEIRLFEHIKHEEPDLFENLKCEEQTINDQTKNIFRFSSGEDKILSFYTWDKNLSFQFLDYQSTINLFPYPEQGFEQFLSVVSEIMSDNKVVVSWIHEEPEPFAELIPTGEEDSYDFLWEGAKKVRITSWSGKLDKNLV